ncbi:MAG: hypothetical protein WC604_00080 [Candidatus Gracilibacteria bacterium]
MPLQTKPTPQSLKKIINECDFLDENFREEWEKKAENMTDDEISFVYKKFKDAKTKVENVYIRVALKHDPTGGDLVKEVLETIKKFS